MPDYIRFSDLKDSHPSQIDGAHDLIALAHPDENSSTGFTSMSTTPNALGAHAVEDQTFVNLKTSNKTIRGAINQTLSNLAPDFNTTAGSTYSEGDCVLYNGVLKKCINPNGTTSGTFITADWTDVKAVDVGSGGGGGSSTLSGLNDVNISSPANNDVLKYNATSQKWENGAGGGSSADHITLTQAQYDALVEAGTVDPDAFYFIEDGSPSAYMITTLNDAPNLFAANTEMTLADDFDKYDELRFYLCMWDSVLYNHFNVVVVPKDVLMKSWQDYNDSSISYQYKGRFEVTRNLSADGTFYTSAWQIVASAKNKLLSASKGVQGWQANTCYIYKVVGVKYSVVGGVPKHEYSTSEQIVGTWIDGRPVYEKTFAITSNISSSMTVAHGISNLDVVVGMNGSFKGTYSEPLQDWATGLQPYQTRVADIDSTNFAITIGNDRVANISAIYITLRYTKSSS